MTAGKHADTLVSDLLEISKIDAGALEPKMSPIGVASALRRVLSRPTNGIIQSHVVSAASVFVDANHFHRMLCNLVDNAMHYGAAPVTIDAVTTKTRVMIAVADSGEGVPAEFVPQLFERFSRSDEARRSRQDGTGLGLAIVAGLAAANGGSVRYERNQPRGSRFVLTLPRALPSRGG